MSAPSAPTVRHVVILGGGSAGWLTAGLLAARRPGALQVTVVESPDIPTIGVGEGTWPTMRDTLREIGLPEADLVRHCDATFKQGSLFRGWVDGADDDRYFHPFSLPTGYTEAPVAAAWLQSGDPAPFAERACVQPHLCASGRGPKQFGTPAYAAVANYAYHFDAGRFGPVLREHCTARLGVRHVPDEVVAVRSRADGDIAALATKAHGDITGDLFVDCSGLKARLLAGHYDVGFVSQRHVLFCDSALALQVPYPDPEAPIACQTISTAHPQGWVWDIGLQARRGVGLVYSSAHCSDDEAQRRLQAYVTATGGAPSELPPPRKLAFDPGHRARFWHRNCVAIGLSAGFLEPLEASAIALVEYAAGWLADQLPTDREGMDIVARDFNAACLHRWSHIIDFLKLHYLLSRRDDSDFWRDHRAAASVPAGLQERLALWRHRAPQRHDFVRHDEAFPSASWQYVLYGMGFRTAPPPLREADRQAAAQAFRETAAQVQRMRPALPSHRALVQHIVRHGQSPV